MTNFPIIATGDQITVTLSKIMDYFVLKETYIILFVFFLSFSVLCLFLYIWKILKVERAKVHTN